MRNGDRSIEEEKFISIGVNIACSGGGGRKFAENLDNKFKHNETYEWIYVTRLKTTEFKKVKNKILALTLLTEKRVYVEEYGGHIEALVSRISFFWKDG